MKSIGDNYMRKGQVEIKMCPDCGRKMKPVKDKIKKTYTGYLFHCSNCMPKGMIISCG